MARRGKPKKEDAPRFEEGQLLNRVTGEVLRQMLDRARAHGRGTGVTSLGTSSWLAGGMGVSESKLSRMLSGKHSVRFEDIWFAADILGLRPAQLVSVVEDAMRRVGKLELGPAELVGKVASGEMTEGELNALIEAQLKAAVDESEPALWELVPEIGAEGHPAEKGNSPWSRLLANPVTSSVVGTVLGVAAGVAAGRFFGGDGDDGGAK